MINNDDYAIHKREWIMHTQGFGLNKTNRLQYLMNKKVDRLYKIVRHHNCNTGRTMLRYEGIKP